MALAGTLFTILAALVLPVSAGIWLSVKKKGYMKPVLLGVLTFGVFQELTRIPALEFLRQTVQYTIFSHTQPVLNAIFLAGTAGLFEEGGRWIVMTLFMKNKRRLTDGVAFGVGHGGLEALLLVGIPTLLSLISSGAPDGTGLTFVGGIERLSTMVVHIGFSVMVWKSVTLKKPLWLVLAFLLHTAIDAADVLMVQAGTSVFLMEGIVLVFALILLAYILIEFKTHKEGAFQ